MSKMIVKIGIIFTLWIALASTFNISPSPNIAIKKKNITFLNPQIRSSYFGYSLTLRQNSIMVGAPRDQSELKSQAEINEPGAIHKCVWSPKVKCHTYKLDVKGDEKYDKKYDTILESDEIVQSQPFTVKSLQMLGSSMDGKFSENSSFIACASNYISYRWIPKNSSFVDETNFNGACYFVKNTRAKNPQNPQMFNSSLFDHKKQRIKKGKKYFFKKLKTLMKRI